MSAINIIRHIRPNTHFTVFLIRTVRRFSVSPVVHKNIKNVLKTNIRNFLENEEYSFGAVKIYGLRYKNIDDVPVSESFSSPNSYWFFNWHEQNMQHYDCHSSMSDFASMSDMDSANDTDRDHADSVTTCSSATIFEKGYQNLEDYINDKELDPKVAIAVKALERFLHEKDVQELSLAQMFMRKGMTETEVASILAKHLLSQLLPYPSNYFLDSNSKGKPDSCPCGCGIPIHFGLTHLGCPFLFHGYADIVLFPTDKDLFMEVDNSSSAVFTLKKMEHEDYGHKIINNNHDNCRDENDIVTDECNLNSLYSGESTMRQICKQAVSSSICKLRRLKKNSSTEGFENLSSMVPVCAITRNCFEVAIYDAEYDFLLKSTNLDIFNQPKSYKLNFPAIVNLWLLINHSLFCSKPNSVTLEALKGTCNLIPQLGEERYDFVVSNSDWLMTPEYFPKRSLTKLGGRNRYQVDQKSKKYPRKTTQRNKCH